MEVQSISQNICNDLNKLESGCDVPYKKQLLETVSKGLINKEISLVEVVEALKSSLAHTNHVERALGTQFLADVIQLLPKNEINCDELNFLVSFFVGKLRDHHSLVPHIIIGFLALVEQENISSEDVIMLIQSFFREVHCQSQVMGDRRNIYNFFKYCIVNRLEDVQKIKTDFIIGFVSSMDGEKDPRNLVLLFSLIPHITKNLSLEAFSEDLFEVTAAYFPIDFVPPKSDPFGVMPEDLIVGLRNSLSSTDAFAPYLIPLLQEKIESDTMAVKLESLLTLKACCQCYRAETLRPHILTLWGSLRKEVIEGWNAEVEEEALSTLSAIISKIEEGPSTQSLKDSATQLANSAMLECLTHLAAPEQRLMFPSSNLLLALSSPSFAITKSICEKVLPLLAEQFDSKTEATGRKNTLIVLAKFMNIAAKYHLFDEEPFIEYEVKCFEALYGGLVTNDIIVQGAALSALSMAVSSLTEEQVCQSTKKMTEILIGENNHLLRERIVETLLCMGRNHPSLLTSCVIPKLLKKIDEDTLTVATNERLSELLETISILTTEADQLKLAVPVLWKQILHLSENGNLKCIHFLHCMNKLIEGSMGKKASHEFLIVDWQGIIKMIDLSVKVIFSEMLSDPVPLLQHISRICQELVPKGDASVVEELVNLLAGTDPNSDHPMIECVSQAPNLKYLISTPSNNCGKSCLLVYSVEGLINSQKSITNYKYFEKLLKKKIQFWSLHAQDERVRETAAMLLASQINKIQPEKELISFLNSIQEEILGSWKQDGATVDEVIPQIRLLGWVTKAFIMRGYPNYEMWVCELESLLLHSEYGKVSAGCYEFLLKDVPTTFSSQNGAIIRMLYKQRFFESRIGIMVEQFKSQTDSPKFNTLLAISHLLPCLPQIVLKAHIEKLLPVLIQGLTCNDLVVTTGAVGTLSSLLHQAVEDVASHVSTLTTALLALSVSATIFVRMKSLECLEKLALLPTTSILPYKEQVVRGLQPVLDDRKRIVRQAATNARCAWVLV